MNYVKYIIQLSILFLVLFACCDSNNSREGPINIDGVLDSIHGEPVNLSISFKYHQDGTLHEIIYDSPATNGFDDYYLNLSYPDDSKIIVRYQSYFDGPTGQMIIHYSGNKIDSVHGFSSFFNSCYPNTYSYYQYLPEKILQIDSTTCTRDGPPYTSQIDTTHWLLNDKQQIIGEYGVKYDAVYHSEYLYDQMVNPLSYSFFQIAWFPTRHYPLIILFPILQKNNIINDNLEIDYNSDGMPVKIKQLIPPQYYLHYSY